MDIYNMPFPVQEDNCLLAVPCVKRQSWETPLEPDKALRVGTIFPSLNLPFTAYERK